LPASDTAALPAIAPVRRRASPRLLRALRGGGTPLLLLLPGLLLTGVIILYPIADLGWTAFHEVSRFGKILDTAGLINFRGLLNDPLFAPALWRTLIWTVVVVGGALLISLPVALILNDDFIGRGLARTIVMLPWAVSLTMTAVVWRWGLNGRGGLLNASLLQAGIISEPIEWLGQPVLAFAVETAIGILVSIPFTTTILLGGLASLPGDIYEAGMLDGASDWQTFRHLTLPLLRPFLNIAVVLNVIYVFNSFPIIWVMTEGGPADETDILVTYLYKLAFRFGQLGKASAISLAMFAILLAFTLVYVRLRMREELAARQEAAANAAEN
jgi:multiple sugar transport system permease protein